MDSIYAGFENGAWLRVQRISDLPEEMPCQNSGKKNKRAQIA